MTQTPLSPSASPRGSVLTALVALVLGLHLVLLAGGITLQLPDTARAPAPPATGASASAANAEPPATASTPAARPQPVQVSTVRWIVPAAPAPAPRPEPAPRPKPVPKAAPTARPAPVPEPVAVAQAAPEPAEAVALAPAETPAIASQEVAVSEPPAPAPEAPAEAVAAPAATPETPPISEPTGTTPSAATDGKPSAPVALPPATPPPSTRLHYDVTGNVKGIGYKAQGTLDWAVADGRYEARMEMRVLLLGSRSQTSIGRIGPEGLMPERFADKSRSEKAAHFDAAQQRIRFSSNAPEAPLQPGAQDRLSLFLQLASLLQARPQAYTTGQTVDMQVAGTGDAPVWRFDVGEESTISLPAGEFKVRHLVRQPRKEFDSTVEMWLAPSLHHLPVRLRVKQSNGDVADQQLSQMP
ncbi:DUF3108 domain-containing protein [Hydrogenophaga sp. UC242_50]|uniref:DUF3108 domain-containing protein n=1 Tax=Hydrogenophaga sp. UC242_50 TaxID=3350169 RepID=UPI0036D3FC0E